jgi:translation initiation factor 2B subunit (eIF-2B alpha/beta/delta family)
LQIQNIRDLLRELREDNTSGANEFIDKALEIFKFQLRLTPDAREDIREEILVLSKQIIDARPSMAPLINTIGYLIHDLEVLEKNIIEERLIQFQIDRKKRKESLESQFHIFLKENKRDPLKVMLISYSSTIINLLLKNKDYGFEIYVLESRPLLEGQKVAEILSPYFKTHLIIDAAIGTFIDEIDIVLIGVDSVLEDGSIINKIGTFPLSVLAYTKKINVYAVCESYKYNLKSHYGFSILIAEKPVREVYNKEITNKFLEVHNYYFDITPSEYISGIISDLGVLSNTEFLERVKKTLPIEWFKYFIDNKKI